MSVESSLSSEDNDVSSMEQRSSFKRNESEMLSCKVRNTFAVYVAPEDIDGNDGLAKILEYLCTKFDKGAVKKDISNHQKKVERDLYEAKYHYFEQLLIYDALQKLLQDVETADVKSFQSDDRLYQLLRKELNSVESQQYLKGRGSVENCDYPLLNNDQQQSTKKLSPEARTTIGREDLLKKIIPRVEKVLSNKSESLIQMLKKGETDVLTAEMLGEKVEEQARLLEEQKSRLSQDSENLAHTFRQCHEAFSGTFDLMSSIINNEKLKEQSQYHNARAHNLVAKCEALALKAKVLNLQVMCETYTVEAVGKLRELRSEVEVDSKRTEQEVDAVTKALAAYEAVGTKFLLLVSEYIQTKEQLEFGLKALEL